MRAVRDSSKDYQVLLPQADLPVSLFLVSKNVKRTDQYKYFNLAFSSSRIEDRLFI